MVATVTNIIKRPDQSPWDNGDVSVAIVGAGFLSGGAQIVDRVPGQTDLTGTASFQLPANNPGELYVWTNPDGKHYPFQVTASSGTFTLKQLSVTQNVAAGVIAVTQDALNAALANIQQLLGTLVPTQSTPPDHTLTQGWVDSSSSPAVLKTWNGTAWVASSGGSSVAFGTDSDGFDTVTA